MKISFALFTICFFGAFSLSAQTFKSERADTPSVVVLPEYARQVPDTAALQAETGKRKKRRRFQVVVVPAPPPGRTRQDILYSDSLAQEPPRPPRR